MLRVVLADDENKVILLMQKLIDWEALGYEIAGTANDGLRALELVREKQPHLLITDVRMPGCDGIELIQRAKALQPKLHFIVISGYRKFEYAQNALKYGVEDYLLKPLKQEELTGILLRLKEKMGQEAALEFQLKRSGEHQQELLLDALLGTAERGTSFLSAGQANGEYGFHFGSGTYAAAVIRVDVPDAESYQDGYRILLRHALEIVRRESGLLTEEFAASLGHAGIAVLLYLRAYHAVEVTQCFTKIRKEIENQRDLFWNVQATVCLGSRRDSLEQVGESMRRRSGCAGIGCAGRSPGGMPRWRCRIWPGGIRWTRPGKRAFRWRPSAWMRCALCRSWRELPDGGGAAGPERADGGGLVPPGSGGMPLRNAPKR